MPGKIISESFSEGQSPVEAGQEGVVLKPECHPPAPVSPLPLPTLCDLISTAPGSSIYGCLSESQISEISNLICEECEPTPTLCELISSATAQDIVDCLSPEQEEGIEGIVCEVPDTVYKNPDGSASATLSNRASVRLLNANIQSVQNDVPNTGEANISVEVDVPMLNSAGDSVAPNVSSLLTPGLVTDVDVIDDNGSVGSFPAPTSIEIDGEVTSASYSSPLKRLTIIVASSTAIIPDRVIPRYSSSSVWTGDLAWQWMNGTYDYSDGPGIKQELDPLAGADHFFRIKHPNVFSNYYRFTDDDGVPSPSGQLGFLADTATPNSPSATPGYFIDHKTGLGWLSPPVSRGRNWYDSMNLVNALTVGPYGDFRAATESEILTLISQDSFIPAGAVDPHHPFGRGLSGTGSFDPSGTGTINQTWLNNIVAGQGRSMAEFRLRVIDNNPTTFTSLIGIVAVRTHF